MQEVVNPERSHVMLKLLGGIVALAVTILMAIGVAFTFAHKPAEKVCRGRGDDWLQSSLQFYFDNTSTDTDKAFEILPGSTWNQRFQGWDISYMHSGKQYSAHVTCAGDIRILHTRQRSGKPR